MITFAPAARDHPCLPGGPVLDGAIAYFRCGETVWTVHTAPHAEPGLLTVVVVESTPGEPPAVLATRAVPRGESWLSLAREAIQIVGLALDDPARE